MKGLIGLGVILGCITAAHAAPETRIVCTGEPRLEGAGEKGVEISTDIVGLVRVVDGLDEGEGKGGEGEEDEQVLSAKDFCAAHEGVDTFILPAPRLLDEPRSPDAEDGLELQEPGRPDTESEDKPLEVADDGGEGGQGTGTMADLPDVGGHYKSFDPQMQTGHGCSQAVGHTRTGWWFALLPLLLLVRVRGEGDR